MAELAESFSKRTVKGEIVVVVDRGDGEVISEEMIEKSLETALQTHSVKDSATIVAEALNIPRRDVYQMALSMNKRTSP